MILRGLIHRPLITNSFSCTTNLNMTASIPGIVSSIAMIIATHAIHIGPGIYQLSWLSTVEIMERLDRSDHNSVAFTLSLPAKQAKCKRKIFLYSKADLETLRTTLANVPWSVLIPANEGYYTHYVVEVEVVFAVVRQHIPLKKINIVQMILGSRQRFFDSFAKRGRRLWKAKELGTDAAWAKYTELSNSVRYATHCNHWEYLQELGASLQTNPKRFWSYVRSCRNTPNNVPALKVGNQLLSEDQD